MSVFIHQLTKLAQNERIEVVYQNFNQPCTYMVKAELQSTTSHFSKISLLNSLPVVGVALLEPTLTEAINGARTHIISWRKGGSSHKTLIMHKQLPTGGWSLAQVSARGLALESGVQNLQLPMAGSTAGPGIPGCNLVPWPTVEEKTQAYFQTSFSTGVSKDLWQGVSENPSAKLTTILSLPQKIMVKVVLIKLTLFLTGYTIIDRP